MKRLGAQVEASARAVEAAGVDCKALIKSCMDFLVSNGPEMKETREPMTLPKQEDVT